MDQPFKEIVASPCIKANNVTALLGRHVVKKLNQIKKKYKLRIRVLSKSHVISKPLRHRLQDSPALQD